MDSIYLDTSVPSAYHDDRARERRDATRIFWNTVLPKYRAFVSPVTIEELNRTTDPVLRKTMLDLVEPFSVLNMNESIHKLADSYIENNVIPAKYLSDALHAACASFHGINYLVSWNFDHLVKARTRKLLGSVNVLEGFQPIEIISPQEL
jgi:predicted nucleic acid-binding protein